MIDAKYRFSVMGFKRLREKKRKMKIILHKNCFEKVDGFLMLTLLV